MPIADTASAHSSLCRSAHEEYPLLGNARSIHTNKRGEPISFADKPMLIPLYAMLPNIRNCVISKATQVGISELLIQLVLHHAGWNDRICAYVLPQYKTCERFVADRVDPVIMRTPAYRARLPGAQMGSETGRGIGNLKRKRFGRMGSLLFLGSNTDADFVEFSCDLAIIDEFDECVQDNLPKINDRVRESRNPQMITVGNPRIPGGGVERQWRRGTRHRWFNKCQRCGHYQALDWFRHFVMRDTSGAWVPRDTERAMDLQAGDLRPVCIKCQRPWTRVADGSVWAPENPERSVQSYHITRMDVLPTAFRLQPIRDAYNEYTMAYGDLRKMEAFYSGFLGIGYQSSGSRVTETMLTKASTEQPMDYNGGDQYLTKTVVMGVDVGSILNVTVSEVVLDGDTDTGYRRKGLWVGTVPNFDDIKDLVSRYSVDVIGIDAYPETRKAKELRDYYLAEGGCEVWLVQYRRVAKVGQDLFGVSQNFEDQLATVDRTQLLDVCMTEISKCERTFPNDVGMVLGFSDQMRAPSRTLDQKSGRYHWDNQDEPDHFRHADAYERVALEMYDRGGRYYEYD